MSKFKDDIKPFVIEELKLPEMLKFMGVVLRRRCKFIFRMEDRLVYVRRVRTPSSDEPELDDMRRADLALMVKTVGRTKLHELNTEFVPWGELVWPKKSKDKDAPPPAPTIKLTAPPKTLSEHFLEAHDRWSFNVLKGTIQTPTLRADGSLLTQPGYDKASGLYLDTDGATFPPIPDKPTKRDALAALALLKEPFSEFPFEQDPNDFTNSSPSLSVALSGILTGLIRRTLRSAPMHLFDAPEAGSGKGLCCSVITLIVTGKEATAITLGSDENDVKKHLFSALVENHNVIVFDNLTRAIEGPSLCSALTEEHLNDRLLGFNVTANVPTNALFMASGNNIEVGGDMHRRVIGARIEPGENPEERTFKRKDLRGWVRENRPALVAAALTVLRAHHCAGYPKADLPAYGSFEQWSDRVRQALVWLGEPDPCLTRGRFKEAEPQRDALGDVLRELSLITGSEWLPVKAIANAKSVDLTNALQIAGYSLEPVSLGKYLSENRGKTVNGIRLEQDRDKKAKVNLYRAVRVGG